MSGFGARTMTIRRRLIVAMLIVSLVPLLTLGVLSLTSARRALTHQIRGQLSSIASIQESRLDAAILGYLQHLSIVDRSPDLQVRLADVLRAPNSMNATRLRDTLFAQQASASTIDAITVLDAGGHLVASTQPAQTEQFAPNTIARGLHADTFVDIIRGPDTGLRVRLAGPVRSGAATIGVVVLEASAGDIVALTEDYTGLGATGETFLARLEPNGDALFVTPLRFDGDAALRRRRFAREAPTPAHFSLAGREEVFSDLTGYRGTRVIAATRFIEPLRWGLVVQIESAEAFAPVERVRNVVLGMMGISLVAVLLVGLSLGHSISGPIARLAAVARAIGAGDRTQRASDGAGAREIAALGEAINRMRDDVLDARSGLEHTNADLERLVDERTTELERANTHLAHAVSVARGGEQRFRAVTESAHDGIVSADALGVIVYVNKKSEEMFGYEPETLVGRPLTLLMPERFHQAHLDGFGRFLRTGEAHVIGQSVELAGVRSNGAEFPLELSLATWDTSEGTFFTGIIRDITERRKNDEAVRHAFEKERELVARLQELDVLKNDFVAVVAHDLRTPMTVIAGFAETLLTNWSTLDDDRKQEFLRVIERNTVGLSDLVDDVLEVARIQSGEFRYENAPFDLGEVLQRAARELTPPDAPARIRLTVPADLPRAFGDAQRQWQIAMNLMSNALKFSGDAPVDVAASAARTSLRVTVTDQGRGIAAEDLDKLFQKFSRVTAPDDAPRVKGTGLGLYICKSMIQAQGGEITVTSVVGEGSTFTYTVPTTLATPMQGERGPG